MNHSSPYASAAQSLRDNGYHVMPVGPKTKVPGAIKDGEWKPMPGWSKYCDAMPPAFIHDQWERLPEAGVCVAHGNVIGLDLDTDREDVARALFEAVTPPFVRRRGAKGWMGYYRPGKGLDGLTARVRWYDDKGGVVVELLLHGTQSVLPPTVHPTTGMPYAWVTQDTLEDTAIGDLPLFTGDDLTALDREFTAIGLTRQAPKKPGQVGSFTQVETGSRGSDLGKPMGRSVNDRAMEPSAIDQWWPAMGLPKTKQRGPGAWEAVAPWRASGSGRALHDRNPNLKIVTSGIRDFGGCDEAFTPINLICRWKGIDPDAGFSEAAEWLGQYIRPEEGMTDGALLAELREEKRISEPVAASVSEIIETEPHAVSALDRLLKRGASDRDKPKAIKPTTPEQFAAAFPSDVPPFPVQDFERDLTGLLRELTLYIDEAANMRSEQGAFGAALAMLGTIMGRKVEVSETGLRTNLYVIGTAESGAGKSSAMNAMATAFEKCGVADRLAGSDFTSGTAILREMGGHVPRLFSIDEFGDVIRRALSPRAASHERDIGRIMKDMYSSASGIYRGKAYATQERQDIMEPHLCVYGVSTHEAFWESIDGRSFNDGLLARFIMIPIGATETQTPRFDRFKMVNDMVTGVVLAGQSRGNLAAAGDVARGVTFGAGVWARWLADRALFQRHSERATLNKIPGAPSVIQRICENGVKIAMISAMGRDPEKPCITGDDYDLGIAVAHWSSIYMIDAIQRFYVENASHRDLNRVRDYIEAGGEDGRTRTAIVRAFQGVFVNAMAGKSILDALVESGQVVAFETKTGPSGGRPRLVFVAADHAEAFILARDGSSNNP